MSNKVKKILKILLLGPVLPILGAVDDSGSGDGDDGKGDIGDDVNDDGTGDDGTNDDNAKEKQVVFNSQEEFDKVISRRINKAIKTKQTEWENTQKKAQMSELEKIQAERDEANKRADAATESANKTLLKADVISKCSSLNIVDADAAYALMSKDDIEIKDGKVEGVKEALKSLIVEKPWLVKNNEDPKPSGDDQNKDTSKNKSKSNMDSILRSMYGR
jgi:hypothetical protein